MADGIDPQIQDMEPAPRDPVIDRPRPDAGVEQLAPGDDTVLPVR